MEMRAPTRADVERIRQWRNETLESFRTPYPLTEEMQGYFYDEIVCNRDHNSRWWSVYAGYGTLVGLAGLTDIEWENGLAQISLIVYPQKQGYGREAVRMVLDEAFKNMGLNTVYGECYECNPAFEFWGKITNENGG